MATVAAIPMPVSRGHTPMVSTFDPSFSPGTMRLSPLVGSNASPNNGFQYPSSPSLSSAAVPMGSRYEKVPYTGSGSATYVRQPTRAQLKENNGVFGSPNRPYFYKDPEEKPFIDIDGKVCGDRWVYVDPLDGESSSSSNTKCCIM